MNAPKARKYLIEIGFDITRFKNTLGTSVVELGTLACRSDVLADFKMKAGRALLDTAITVTSCDQITSSNLAYFEKRYANLLRRKKCLI